MGIDRIIDLSKIERGYRGYASGSLKRLSIIYEGDYYLLKYPDRNRNKTHDLQVSSYLNNSLSEYVGCRIFESVGIPAQQTLLAKSDDNIVVACKDFIDRDRGMELQEFSNISKEILSSSDAGRYPSIEKIYRIIEQSAVLKNIRQEAIDRYWDMQVVDALIGNFDRHTGNWGYVVNTKTGEAYPSPIYDCGSSLWPKIDDDVIAAILDSEEHLAELTQNLPKGRIQFNDNGERVSWAIAFASNENQDCVNAVKRIVPRIDMNAIAKIIDNTPFLAELRKELFKEVIARRFEHIHERAFRVLNAADRAIEPKGGLIRSNERDLRDNARAAGTESSDEDPAAS
jgi:hypothetical protein